ncbi:DNA-binding transcriptional regulator, Lrp family [Halovenus aranensis]|jgi:DNA-binding Lrp family transcriptional regulator|uniref:DNA-binding transcriptional regulator, Lrp family n=1 Tax=Halovenus aranensis TaxID=890420 RepID=A0A1G8S6P1_9EURY|nr:Lrp/AsnC family transcriptional regulator [Halovenus aranensis]SDJ24833.1 DNA-binding transcriptional regulator, Lrp family [Halovenus aranensis]
MNGRLDEVDKMILFELQKNARDTSSNDIAEQIGLSASTVRNRISKLEEQGIIRGYHVDIDYERAGYPLYTKIICTAPIDQREELAESAMEVRGVTAVREIMTGERNIYVNAIGEDHDELSRIGRELTDLGLTVVDEQLIRDEFVCPFHGFLGEHPDCLPGDES